jgi:hypothetical protein
MIIIEKYLFFRKNGIERVCAGLERIQVTGSGGNIVPNLADVLE